MKPEEIYQTNIPESILKEEHEPISFEEFITPALHFDMKAYRKRLAKEKAKRKLQKDLPKLKKF